MRIERVGLEHDADVAIARLDLVDHPAVEAHLARARRIDPGEQEQGRRLAAARRPEQGDELAVLDREVEMVDRDHLAPRLVQTGQLDPRHQPLIPPMVICVRYFWVKV